jgi:hypothetical protein
VRKKNTKFVWVQKKNVMIRGKQGQQEIPQRATKQGPSVSEDHLVPHWKRKEIKRGPFASERSARHMLCFFQSKLQTPLAPRPIRSTKERRKGGGKKARKIRTEQSRVPSARLLPLRPAAEVAVVGGTCTAHTSGRAKTIS